MFSASPWLEIYIDFQISHLAEFEQFKADIYFANFGQVKIDPIRSFLLSKTGHIYFTEFGWDVPWRSIQTRYVW